MPQMQGEKKGKGGVEEGQEAEGLGEILLSLFYLNVLFSYYFSFMKTVWFPR